jgi:hypothetical protein
VKFCGHRLHGLLGHAAGGDVLKDPLLYEVLDLSPEAAVQHLGHVWCEALEEAGGIVRELVVEVVVLLLVHSLATERYAWGRTSRTCPPCTAGASGGG